MRDKSQLAFPKYLLSDIVCSDSRTKTSFLRSIFRTGLDCPRSSVISPESYAGMAAGRDYGAPDSSPGKRQPLPALFALSPAIPLRTMLLLVLMTLSEEVIEYLFSAKCAEEDVWLRDDIAIAIRTVVLAEEGVEHPDVCATYEVLGLHPNQVWPAIQARRRALLGDDLYEAFYGETATAPPKKPSQSVLPQKAKEQAA